MNKIELEEACSKRFGYTSNDFREMFYEALVEAGVDNWEGYDEAIQIYKSWLKDELKGLNSE